MFDAIFNAITVRALDRYVAGALDSIPCPRDSRIVRSPGPSPDRILIVGGAAVRGFGVGSYELGIGGHLARQLSVLTGRGTRVELDGESPRSVNATAALLAARDLSSFDVLILMLGARESSALAGLTTWQRQMPPLLAELDARSPDSLIRLVVGVPPLREVMPLPRVLARLIGRRSSAMNVATEEWCSTLEHTTFVPFFPRPVTSRDGYAGAATYRSWAETLSAVVSAVLVRRAAVG